MLIGRKLLLLDLTTNALHSTHQIEFLETHTNTTAAQNDVTLSYHSVRGLYFMAVVFVRCIETHKKFAIELNDNEIPVEDVIMPKIVQYIQEFNRAHLSES